jgi:hypothetical protein
MKRLAFTMLELVFAIVVIGILSAVIIPRMNGGSLFSPDDSPNITNYVELSSGPGGIITAGLQVASHIRYTQHLAMVDDKYIPDSSFSKETGTSAVLEAKEWYKSRWHIFFSRSANNTVSYSIISDSTKSTYDGNPNADFTTGTGYSEVARDPLNPNIYLIGTTYASFDSDHDERINRDLDLGRKYSVKDIVISGGNTGSNATRIIFDHLGRPYRGAINSLSGPTDRLAESNIIIKLCKSICTLPKNKINSDDEFLITVAPETGYVNTILDEIRNN